MNSSPNIYQVSQLADEMRRLMEVSYPEIWIEGELSSLSTPASGHLYFSLKDDRSQLRCAMFKGRAGVSRYKPKVGDLVRVRAKISVYTARGDLQCIVQHMEEAGEGILQRQFDELKQRLSAEGLFSVDHKQTIPSFAQHIGIITSPSGAAVRDILTTLKRRCPWIPVTIYPAVVQGDSAAASIVSAIRNAVQHQRCDVLVVTRGGGSLEDLWCFNHEDVAREIHRCPIPIVSGVGHEVDVTIADLVADLRAPTPTAAAEMLSPDTDQLIAKLQGMQYRLPKSLERLFQRLAQTVDMTARRLVHPRQQLENKNDRLRQLSTRLRVASVSKISRYQDRANDRHRRLIAVNPLKRLHVQAAAVTQLGGRLKRSEMQNLETSKQQLNALGGQLNLVSPLATVDRGFAIITDAQDNIVRHTDQVIPSDRIQVRISDGELDCEVLKVQTT